MMAKSSVNGLSQPMIEMIERKRRLAIEKRNKRQAIDANNDMSCKSVPTSHPIIGPITGPTIGPTIGTITGMTTSPTIGTITGMTTSPTIGPTKSGQNKVLLKASTSLVSNKRFALNITHNSEVVAVLRRVESRDWDQSTKVWTFDVIHYKHVLTQLKTLSSLVIHFEDLVPDLVIIALIEANNGPKEDIDLSERLTTQLMQQLYSFQAEGIKFGIRTGGRCLIADDMGLGKTLQAISIAQWFRQDWPLLIVCPSSLRYQWRDQINHWLPNIDSNDIFVVTKVKEGLPQALIVIISYDLMAKQSGHLNLDNNQRYNFVILDESHNIKNELAVRTDAVSQLAQSSKRILLLSGTPALSRPMELFTQIKLINPKLFLSKHEFGIRYCNAHPIQFAKRWQRGKYAKYGQQKTVWDYKGASNLNELKILLEFTILVRRLKSEVLTDLTKKRREMIIINVDHLSDKKKKKLLNYRLTIKKVSFPIEDNSSHFEWYFYSGLAKVEPVCKYLEQLLNKDIKLLCFCHHKAMMDAIQHVLAHKRINHIRIDGSTPAGHRQDACNEFQTVNSCRVALLSITACCTGLNLTAASVVVFAELYWNPGILAQAEDRIHRIGQKSDVMIYYLVANDTIDSMIWPMISQKLLVLNKAGLSKDNFDPTSVPLNALEAEQHLITEFFTSLNDDERSALMNDDFDS